jgi:plastocyanin
MSRSFRSSAVCALVLVGSAALSIANCGGSSSPVASSALPPARAQAPAPTPTPTPTPEPTPAPTPATTPAPAPAPAPTPTPSPTPMPTLSPITIDITSSMTFSPGSASVQVGQQILWHNADSIAHTATQNGGAFDTGLISPGATSAPITLKTTGTIGYHCAVHPGMVGTLSVTP